VLPEENRDQVAAFLARHADFAVEPFTKVWTERLGGEPPRSADGSEETLQLTPARHATDGFFVALMRRHNP
jgi:16S rRNA (cytosine967-C5)-methyltransferase